MRIIHLSYARVMEYQDPFRWLDRLKFLTVLLEKLALHSDVQSVHLINHSGVLKRNGVTFHFLKRSRWQAMFPLSLHRYINHLKPQVVVVHGLIFPLQVIMLRLQLGKGTRIIVQHHAERPLRHIRKLFQKTADRYISAYLFASAELASPWISSGQIGAKTKVREIMGTSSPFFPLSRSEAWAFSGVNGDRVYLWVGRLDANKAPIMAAKAFLEFAQTNPGVKLYMIFQTVELIDQLKSLLSSALDRSQSICLVGKVNYTDIHYWYSSADFILSTSNYEGSGVAVCEAMSCGCIPVLTNIPSFRMMTDDGRIGILYEAGDERSLLAALERSIALDRAAEKNKVLQHFEQELSFDANARKFMRLANELVARM